MTELIRRDAEFLLYQTQDGRTRVEVRFAGETAWLSLGQMADLFQRDKSVISRHVKNVFEEGELERTAVVADFATTALDGKTYQVEHFALDVIISVGYRVKSHRGTQFRIWATQRLREYIVKGFTLDDERLKRAGGGNYFDELLARIRDIRSSEKVFWRKVLDIYATSIDYDPRIEASQLFFKTVQSPTTTRSRRPRASMSDSQKPARCCRSRSSSTSKTLFMTCCSSRISVARKDPRSRRRGERGRREASLEAKHWGHELSALTRVLAERGSKPRSVEDIDISWTRSPRAAP